MPLQQGEHTRLHSGVTLGDLSHLPKPYPSQTIDILGGRALISYNFALARRQRWTSVTRPPKSGTLSRDSLSAHRHCHLSEVSAQSRNIPVGIPLKLLSVAHL